VAYKELNLWAETIPRLKSQFAPTKKEEGLVSKKRKKPEIDIIEHIS